MRLLLFIRKAIAIANTATVNMIPIVPESEGNPLGV
jgi:hypothetical protein